MRVHCFFLVCPDETPRHVAWDIGHASSTDLERWTHHGIVLRRGPAGAWDGSCLATGSVLRHRGRYWMAYTGNWLGPVPAVGLATSRDLASWEKLAGNPITGIDEHHYTAQSRGRRRFAHWRDPDLFVVGDAVYQVVCATAADQSGPAGSIGVARTRDMTSWELLPPLDVDPFAEELECPQIIAADGRYFLLFSTLPDLLLASQAASTDDAAGNMYSMVGQTPLGPFHMLDPTPILPAGMPDRPYAGRIVWHGGAAFLLGTVWSDSGDRICDPIPVELTPNGIRARASTAECGRP